MDKVTEFVTHFIGAFELAAEEARLRDAYEKFKALQDAQPELDLIDPQGASLKAPFKLEDFTPAGRFRPSSEEEGFADTPFAFGTFRPELGMPSTAPLPSSGYEVERTAAGGGSERPTFTLEPPGSMAAVVHQTNHLSDDDVITGAGTQDFKSPDFFFDTLQALARKAEGMQILETEEPVSGADTLEVALNLKDAVKNAEASDADGVSTFLAKGSGAFGQFQDGEAVDAQAEIEDLLPEYLQPEDPPEDDGTPPEIPEIIESEPDAPPIDIVDVDPGHAVVSGGNMMVNEVAIGASWLDAPVFAVMGDVVDLTAISQINVMVDQDMMGSGVEAGGAPSEAINMATLEAISSPLDTGSGGNAGGLPFTAVTRIEADITLVNWVHQYSFATDTDRAEITFSGAETRIGLGDNLIANAANLLEIGFGYDLIIIGGNMISISMIEQTNVLLDNDSVTIGAGGVASASGSDNLLLNSAGISQIGIDSHTALTQPFADAADDLAGGGMQISSDVAGDALFDGMEMLRVLYIEGDFVTMNMVSQTNILGDADQIHLAMATARAEHGGTPEVTAGSNALLNIASLTAQGTDSTVMVGGEVYSDALLYQAEFIETGAPPTGVATQGLANEAVAFLAEDMMAPPPSVEETIPAPQLGDGSTSPDVMQTMLA